MPLITDMAQEILIDYLTGCTSLLIGRHGIGKTEVFHKELPLLIKEFFKLNYLPETINIRPAEHDATELGGFPDLAKNDDVKEGMLVYTYPEWWRHDLEDRFVIIAIDELTGGDNLTQKVLYRLLDSRMVHQKKLPWRWVIVAACNPDTEEYKHISLPTDDKAFESRFNIYKVNTDLTACINYWNGEEKNESFTMKPPVPVDKLEEKINHWQNLTLHKTVVDYLRTHKEELDRGKNCPRSWTKFMRLLTVIEECIPLQKKAQFVNHKTNALFEKETVLDFNPWYNEHIREVLTKEEIFNWNSKTEEKVKKILEDNRSDLIHKVLDDIAKLDIKTIEKYCGIEAKGKKGYEPGPLQKFFRTIHFEYVYSCLVTIAENSTQTFEIICKDPVIDKRIEDLPDNWDSEQEEK